MLGGPFVPVASPRHAAWRPFDGLDSRSSGALDVLVQEQILDLMVQLQRDLDLAYLFISHDLAVVRLVAHEVYVMQHGRVVEHGEPEAIFGSPKEEYTRRLVAAIPGRRAAVR